MYIKVWKSTQSTESTESGVSDRWREQHTAINPSCNYKEPTAYWSAIFV